MGFALTNWTASSTVTVARGSTNTLFLFGVRQPPAFERDVIFHDMICF